MSQQVTEGAPPRYFAIHDATGDGEVWALVRINNGLYEMWTGDDEWVDVPFFASYFGGGENGARSIEDTEVETLKGTVTPPMPGAVALMKGTADGSRSTAPADAPEAPPAPDAAPAAPDAPADVQEDDK